MKDYRGLEEKENAISILKKTLNFIKGGPDSTLEEDLLEVINYIEGQK